MSKETDYTGSKNTNQPAAANKNDQNPSLDEFEEQRFHGTGGIDPNIADPAVSDHLEPRGVISPEGFQEKGAYIDAVFLQELDMSPEAGIAEVEEQAIDGQIEDGQVTIEYGPLMDEGYQGSMDDIDARNIRRVQAFSQIDPKEAVSVDLDRRQGENALTATISYDVDELQEGTYEAVDVIESLNQVYDSFGSTPDGEV